MTYALRILSMMMTTLLVVMVSAPASLLSAAVAHFSEQRILLADADGRWWQGSAWVSVSLPGQPALTLPGRIHWTLEIDGPGFHFEGPPWITQPFSAYWRGKVELSPGKVQLPAYALLQLGQPFTLLRPNGKLNVRWQNADQTEIEWMEAESALSPLPKLGDYRFTWRPGQLKLTTLRGPLHLNGEAAQGQSFVGNAYSEPETAEKLAGLLNILGPTSNGITTLRF